MATTIITKNGSGVPTTDDLSTGELAIDLTNKRLYSYDGTSVIELGVNTASSLNVTGTVTADGLTVDGAATISVSDNSDNLSLISTDTDDNSGPNLRMYRNSSSPDDNYVLGQIDFEGKNDATQDVRYGFISAKISDASDGTEDGQLRFFTIAGGTETQTLTMESAKVGIGASSPSAGLHVLTDTNPVLKLDRGSANTANANLYYNGTLTGQLSAANTDFQISAAGASTPISFYTNGSQAMAIDASQNVGIGVSPSSELHVKGADETQVYIEAPAGSNAGIRLLENGTSKWTIGNDQSNDGLFFYDFTATAERLRIDSSGHAIIPAGVTLGTAAGTYNAANTLDDYEEGTFTATISCDSGTISLEGGANLLSYTKIGRLVHIQGSLNVLSVSSPSGQFRITGLPFAMDTGIGEGADISSGSAALYSMASDVSGLVNAEVSMVGADATILIRDGGGTAAGVSGIANKFDADSIVRISITYHTTS